MQSEAVQSWTVFERAYDDWHLLLMPYGHERLGAVGGRITSYSYTNTPFPLWAPRLILLEALSSPGGSKIEPASTDCRNRAAHTHQDAAS